MRFDELAARLKKLYAAMEKGEKSNIYFFFAYLYAEEIADMKARELKALYKAAGVKESFSTEIAKGKKLAPYIKLKSDIEAKLRAMLEEKGNSTENPD